ncbi:hypothetical protein JCM10213_001416 [Rhodosporidiobolus nylandii]
MPLLPTAPLSRTPSLFRRRRTASHSPSSASAPPPSSDLLPSPSLSRTSSLFHRRRTTSHAPSSSTPAAPLSAPPPRHSLASPLSIACLPKLNYDADPFAPPPPPSEPPSEVAACASQRERRFSAPLLDRLSPLEALALDAQLAAAHAAAIKERREVRPLDVGAEVEVLHPQPDNGPYRVEGDDLKRIRSARSWGRSSGRRLTGHFKLRPRRLSSFSFSSPLPPPPTPLTAPSAPITADFFEGNLTLALLSASASPATSQPHRCPRPPSSVSSSLSPPSFITAASTTAAHPASPVVSYVQVGSKSTSRESEAEGEERWW